MDVLWHIILFEKIAIVKTIPKYVSKKETQIVIVWTLRRNDLIIEYFNHSRKNKVKEFYKGCGKSFIQFVSNIYKKNKDNLKRRAVQDFVLFC